MNYFPHFLPLPPPVFCPVSDDDLFINYIAAGTPGVPGPQGPQGPEGPQGLEGVSVVNAIVESNPGDLIITLSDGTTINAGNVIGPQGPQGEPGTAGKCECKTITVSEDYFVTSDDCYIGVNSNKPTIIFLPESSSLGHTITVKAQMGPPIGNRKVTVKGSIDGSQEYVLTVPYSSITIIYNNGWFTI